MALIPEDRLEQILAGENITPETREEAFLIEAVAGGGGGSDLPEPGTAGNVLTSTGEGWESAAPESLPTPGTAGNVLTSTGDGWESAALPESNEFPVVFTGGDGVYTTVTRITAIIAAAAAKKRVTGYVPVGDVTVIATLDAYHATGVNFVGRLLNSDGQGTVTMTQLGLLGVTNGEQDGWTAAQLT